MAEDIITQINGIPLPNRRTRKQIVVATILFNWFCIAMLLWKGDPFNSLHTSSLAWSYSVMIAVIFAYVFGAVVDNFTVWKNTGKLN